MKKSICLIISIIICVTLSSCKKTTTFKDTLTQYVTDKYDCECNITSTFSNKSMTNPIARIYFTNSSLNGHEAFAQFTTNNNVKIFSNNYPLELKHDEIIEKLDNILTPVYKDFSIELNLFKSTNNQMYDIKDTTDKLLEDSNSGIRACVYIKSDDDFDTRNKKIVEFTDSLKQSNIFVECIYFAFVKDGFDYDEIHNHDYTYDYFINNLYAKDKLKEFYIDEYNSFWQPSENCYNFVANKDIK